MNIISKHIGRSSKYFKCLEMQYCPDKEVRHLPESFMDLSLMFNSYKNVSADRKLTEKEWLIIDAIEEKFMRMIDQIFNPSAQP